jgi:hypothetical protein
LVVNLPIDNFCELVPLRDLERLGVSKIVEKLADYARLANGASYKNNT